MDWREALRIDTEALCRIAYPCSQQCRESCLSYLLALKRARFTAKLESEIEALISDIGLNEDDFYRGNSYVASIQYELDAYCDWLAYHGEVHK